MSLKSVHEGGFQVTEQDILDVKMSDIMNCDLTWTTRQGHFCGNV